MKRLWHSLYNIPSTKSKNKNKNKNKNKRHTFDIPACACWTETSFTGQTTACTELYIWSRICIRGVHCTGWRVGLPRFFFLFFIFFFFEFYSLLFRGWLLFSIFFLLLFLSYIFVNSYDIAQNNKKMLQKVWPPPGLVPVHAPDLHITTVWWQEDKFKVKYIHE